VSEEGKLGSITKRPLNDGRAGELIADSYDDALKKLRADGKVDVADKSLTGKDLKGAYIYYKTGTEDPEEVSCPLFVPFYMLQYPQIQKSR
jgi:hypothetical protein